MAFEITVDATKRVAVATHRGESSVDECQRVLAAVIADKRIGPQFGLLLDIRLMEFEPTTEELRGLGGTIGACLKGRVAILTGTAVQYGLARQSEVFGELRGATIEVFSELDAAMAWLTGGAEFDPLAELQGD